MNVDMPNPVTLSSDWHRTPSPVEACEGLSPVALVLEGMRKQRMSLVQSLRQYLYCHRGTSIYATVSNPSNPQRSSRATSILLTKIVERAGLDLDLPRLNQHMTGVTSATRLPRQTTRDHLNAVPRLQSSCRRQGLYEAESVRELQV